MSRTSDDNDVAASRQVKNASGGNGCDYALPSSACKTAPHSSSSPRSSTSSTPVRATNNYANTNTPIMSAKRPRRRVSGNQNGSGGSNQGRPAPPLATSAEQSGAAARTPPVAKSSCGTTRADIDTCLSPMHSTKSVPSNSHDPSNTPPLSCRGNPSLPTVDSNLSEADASVAGMGSNEGDDESPSNESSSSWVGRKVDALFSPVLSFLHGAAAANAIEGGDEGDTDVAVPSVALPSVSSLSSRLSGTRSKEGVNDIDAVRSEDSEDRADAVSNAIRDALREAADDLDEELACAAVKSRTSTDDSYDRIPGMAKTESSGDGHFIREEDEDDGSRYADEKKALVDADGDVDMVDYFADDRPMAGGDKSYDTSSDININDTESHNYEASVQQGTPANDQEEESDAEDEDEFNPYFFIKSLPPYRLILPPGWAAMPKRLPLINPASTPPVPEVCLVLDLDETLVHCTVDSISDADMVFPVEFNGMEYQVHVRCRPYLTQFLEAVHERFEVVVFTASQQVYADKLLDRIDPEGKYIRHRMFRDSCLPVEGNFLKDLNVLGRDLRKAVLVDNSPHAFGYQVDNGIPIESWFDDPQDTELLKLERFLRTLEGVDDVRDVVREKFQTYRLVMNAE